MAEYADKKWNNEVLNHGSWMINPCFACNSVTPHFISLTLIMTVVTMTSVLQEDDKMNGIVVGIVIALIVVLAFLVIGFLYR